MSYRKSVSATKLQHKILLVSTFNQSYLCVLPFKQTWFFIVVFLNFRHDMSNRPTAQNYNLIKVIDYNNTVYLWENFCF